MKIGIVGTGPMNVALAANWAPHNHQIRIGSRSVERARAVAATIASKQVAAVNDYLEAAAFGEVVFYAIEPASAVSTAAKLRDALAGKVVIDANNVPANASALSAPSLAEAIAAAVPGSRLVKAFNVVRAETLTRVLPKKRPKFEGQYFSIYHCGNDDGARRTVAALIEELFLDPIDCGDLTHAYELEAMGNLAAFLAKQRYGADFAINVAHRRESSPMDSWF
ncbi:MAG: NAD(P)-binding domain-containing protein [Candidatus Velthaea sp.]